MAIRLEKGKGANICKNCIKADVFEIAKEFEKKPVDEMYIEGCDYFKDRNRFVELPCKVGDTVYYITGLSRKYIKSAIVNEIVINCNGISDLFVSNDTVNFENSFDVFYLTREEAERVLKNENRIVE